MYPNERSEWSDRDSKKPYHDRTSPALYVDTELCKARGKTPLGRSRDEVFPATHPGQIVYRHTRESLVSWKTALSEDI